MAVTKDSVQQLYIAYYGRPADQAGLDYWTNRANAEGLNAVVNAFGNSEEATNLYGKLSTEARVNKLYQNMFGRDADVEGLNFYVGKVLDGTYTLATLAKHILDGVNPNVPESKADGDALAQKLAAANAFTQALDTTAEILKYDEASEVTQGVAFLAGITAATTDTEINSMVDAATAALVGSDAVGKAFTLTTGADAIVGTDGKDTITALSIKTDGAGATTFSAFDTIDGGAGSDTLDIYTTNAFNSTFPSNTTVKNVEIVNIHNAEGAAALADASKFEGVEQLWQIAAASNVTKLAETTTAGFRNVDANIAVAVVDAAATAKIALDNLGEGRSITVTSGAAGKLNSVTVAGTVKDTNADKTVAANALNITVGKDVESLTVNTANKTTLTVTNGAGTKAVSAVDASASAGAIAYNAATSVSSVKTGAGDDAVTLNTVATATSKTASVATGEGKDIIDVKVNANGQTGVKVAVDAGAGDDKVNVDNTGVVGIDIKAGEGNDIVTLVDGLGSLASTDVVDAGDGIDTLVIAGKTMDAEDYITLNEVTTGFEAVKFTTKVTADASRMSGYKTIETAVSTSAAQAQAAFNAYVSADAAADAAEAADAAAAAALVTANATDAVALRATANTAAATAAATDAVVLRAAATSAQATADLTNAVTLRATATTLQATADQTDAATLSATATTLQATADQTNATALRATATTLQATADQTDATALRATATTLQATADQTDATALRATADTAATAQSNFAALAAAYSTALAAYNTTQNIGNATSLINAYEALVAGGASVTSAVAPDGNLLNYALAINNDHAGDTALAVTARTTALTTAATNTDTAADAAEAADTNALAADAVADAAEAADVNALAADAVADAAEAADADALAADAAADNAEDADAAAADALAAAVAANAADVAAANADALADAAEALDAAAVAADTAADNAEAADAAAVATDAAADAAEAADAAYATAQATANLTDAAALRAASNAALANYNTLNAAVVAETSVVTKVAADQALIANGSLNATAAGYVLDSDNVAAGNQTTYAGSLDITAKGDGTVITAQAESVNLKVAGLVSGDVDVILTGDIKSATVALTNGVNNDKAELATEDTIASVNVTASAAALKAMTSLTLTGNGEANVINDNGSALVTVDASALGGTYALGADKGDTTHGLNYWSNSAKSETIKLGSGIDFVNLTNSTVKNMDTVTGLNLVDNVDATGKQIDFDLSDVLVVNVGSFEKVTTNATSLNLALIDLAASATKNEVVFAFGGDTYIYADNGTEANFVDDADMLVKVTGLVDLDLLADSLNTL